MIIAIIAPLRFKKEIMHEYVKLSLQGHIVLLPVDVNDMEGFSNAYNEDAFSEELMQLHKEKIDMSGKCLVMNVHGYMGRGTYEEIGYATVKGIPIEYYEPLSRKGELSNAVCRS
jgi:hypothetical protein